MTGLERDGEEEKREGEGCRERGRGGDADRKLMQ